MRKLRTRAGVAAIATAATVGAFVVPAALGGAVADAVPPTALTATPATQTIDQGQNATITVNSNNALGGGHIYVVVSSGPDAGAYPYATPQQCTGGVTATCTITNGGSAGTDNVIVFYSATPSAYTGQTPSATATVIIAGPLAQLAVSPASAHQAQGQWQKYVITAEDASGNAKGGVNLTGSISQANAVNADLFVATSDPGNAWNGYDNATHTGTASGSGPLPATCATSGGCGAGVSVGQTVVWVSSKAKGTVNLSVTPTSGPGHNAIVGNAALTVNPGSANDITQVVLSPTTQNVFQNVTVTETATLENAQGDVVGDERNGLGLATGNAQSIIGAKITSGPNSDAVPSVGAAAPNRIKIVPIPPSSSQQQGSYTITYKTKAASTSTNTLGTDNLEVWAQLTTGPATINEDAGEPKADATINVVARPNNMHLTCPVGTQNQATTNDNTQVICQLYGSLTGPGGQQVPLPGYVIDFAIDPSSTGPSSASYSVSPTSPTTGADGRVAVTVTDPAPRLGDTVVVDVNLDADPSITNQVTITYTNGKSQDHVMISPYVNTSKIGSSVTFTASTVDSSGNPVSGVSYVWTVQGNQPPFTTQSGNTQSFTYTDFGSSSTDHSDTVIVGAYINGALVDTDLTTQYWVRDGQVDQLNGDLSPFSGHYNGQGTNPLQGPFTPAGFTKQNAVAYPTNSDPTATTPSVATQVVEAALIDTNKNVLYGQDVTFSSTGVGEFTDANGKPIGNTITTKVDDTFGTGGVENGQPNKNHKYLAMTDPSIPNVASAFIRSSVAGTQTITITAGGHSDVVLVKWGGQFVPVNPTRIWDTRTGQGGAGGCIGGALATNPGTPLHPNQLCEFTYATTPLPLNATAYVFNVTAIHPNAVGNLRVAGVPGSVTNPSTVPDTSLINYQVGKDSANAIVVGATGFNGIVLYSDNATVNVAIDLEGYYTAAGFDGLDTTTGAGAVRVGDTRTGVGFGSVGKLGAGQTKSITVTGPSSFANTNGHSLKAVLVNVTAIHPSGAGNLRIFSDGQPVPTISNINYQVGVDKAAFDVVMLPANGKIDVYSDGSPVDVAVDVYGYLDDRTSTTFTQPPVRALDTRISHQTLASDSSVSFQVTGVGGVPADAQAVLVSVTSIHNAGSNGVGNLRIYPAGGGIPNTSVVNYISPTTDVANFAYVSIGAGGQVSLYNDSKGSIDAAVDILGYVPAGA